MPVPAITSIASSISSSGIGSLSDLNGATPAGISAPRGKRRARRWKIASNRE
ncbi:MAG: hypothetical protein ACE1ZN_05555 [Dehalococcoidia bacterium]